MVFFIISCPTKRKIKFTFDHTCITHETVAIFTFSHTRTYRSFSYALHNRCNVTLCLFLFGATSSVHVGCRYLLCSPQSETVRSLTLRVHVVRSPFPLGLSILTQELNFNVLYSSPLIMRSK